MVKIKILKETETCKVGKIVESSKKNAENYVSQGFAEYVTKVPKNKKVEHNIKSDKWDFLKPYINQIVVVNGVKKKNGKIVFPQWIAKREKFLFDGTIKKQNLREILKDEIVIEFDFTNDELQIGSEEFEKVRKEAEGWIEKVKQKLIRLKRNFKITDHKGKSPHIRLHIEGLENVEQDIRSEYKRAFGDELLIQIGFNSKNLKLDFSLLTSSSKLISLEYQPHWKKEWGGNIEEVVFEYNDGERGKVRPEMVEKIKQYSTRNTFVREINVDIKEIDKEGITKFWQENFLPSKRNKLVIALGGICRRFNIPQEQAVGLLKELLSTVKDDEGIQQRVNEFSYSYKIKPTEVAVLTHLKAVFGDESEQKYTELKKLFRAKKGIFLELQHYLEYSEFFIDEEITFEINQKHITAKKDEDIIIEWSAKKTIKESNIQEIARLVHRFNENKEYATETPKGDATTKKYSVEDVMEVLIKTSLFSDLVNAKKQYEQLLEQNFGVEHNIEEITIENSLEDIKGFRRKTHFEIKELCLEVNKEQVVNGAIQYSHINNIYTTFAGKGGEYKLFITKPQQVYHAGLNEDYIGYFSKNELVKFLAVLSRENLCLIAKKIGVQTINSDRPVPEKELKMNIFERHKTNKCFIKPIPPVQIEELAKCNNIQELLTKAINGGLKRHRLVDLAYSLTFGKIRDLPQNHNLMAFKPHGIIVTGTKTGKSSSAGRIGKNHDKITVAGALGFATSDSRELGAFHYQTCVQAIDEIKEYTTENIAAHFLNYLENGIYTNTSGIRNQCVGCHPVFIQSNPKENTDYKITSVTNPDEIAYSFINMLAKVTDNYVAMGSRLGIVIYRPDLTGVEGIPLNQEVDKKVLAIYSFIEDFFSEEYTALYSNKDVIEWLWKPYSTAIRNTLTELAKKSSSDDLKSFILGHRESYKHLRGGALNLAFIEQLQNLLKGNKLDYQKLIQDAEENVNLLINYNFDSLKRLTKDLDEDVYFKFLDSLFDSLEGKKKMLVELVGFTLFDENLENTDEILVSKMAEKVGFLAKNRRFFDKNTPKITYENFRKCQIEEIFEKRWQQYFDALSKFGMEPLLVDKTWKIKCDWAKQKYLLQKIKTLYFGSNGSCGSPRVEETTRKNREEEVPQLPKVTKKETIKDNIIELNPTETTNLKCTNCGFSPCNFHDKKFRLFCSKCATDSSNFEVIENE